LLKIQPACADYAVLMKTKPGRPWVGSVDCGNPLKSGLNHELVRLQPLDDMAFQKNMTTSRDGWVARRARLPGSSWPSASHAWGRLPIAREIRRSLQHDVAARGCWLRRFTRCWSASCCMRVKRWFRWMHGCYCDVRQALYVSTARW